VDSQHPIKYKPIDQSGYDEKNFALKSQRVVCLKWSRNQIYEMVLSVNFVQFIMDAMKVGISRYGYEKIKLEITCFALIAEYLIGL
jgi:hypothetical protein